MSETAHIFSQLLFQVTFLFKLQLPYQQSINFQVNVCNCEGKRHTYILEIMMEDKSGGVWMSWLQSMANLVLA